MTEQVPSPATILPGLLLVMTFFIGLLPASASPSSLPSDDEPGFSLRGVPVEHSSSVEEVGPLSAQANEEGGEEETGTHGGSAEGESGGHGDGGSTWWIEFAIHSAGVLLLVLAYFLWAHQPIKNALSRRAEDIQNRIQTAENELENVRRESREMEAKLNNLEEEFEEERREMRERGRKMKEEAIEEARKQAEQRIEDAKEEAKRERKRARVEIRQEMRNRAFSLIRSYFEDRADADLHDHISSELFGVLEQAESLESFARRDSGISKDRDSSANGSGGHSS